MRFLFVLWDGAGAITVEARLIARLCARGHHVTVLGPSSIEPRLRATGCDFIVDRAQTPYDSGRDFPPDEVLWMRDNVWFGTATAQARDVLAAVESVGADVVVCDGLLYGALAAAEASGLPSAELWASLYGIAFRARELPRGDPRRALWEGGLGDLNAARTSIGLPELGSVFEQRDAIDRLLLLTIRELDDDDVELPRNVRYVGPVLEEPTAEREAVGSEAAALISFSTGNMNQAELLQRAIDGVAASPVRGVVTLGPALEAAQFDVPPNVTAYAHLAHSSVLPHAAVVVTHAGHGTVIAALAHGVPLVCIPMGRDQHHVARRVAARGAGIMLDSACESAEITRAVEEVLGEPAYRRHAGELMTVIAKTVREDLAVRELEALG